jgi:hypothetical protein
MPAFCRLQDKVLIKLEKIHVLVQHCKIQRRNMLKIHQNKEKLQELDLFLANEGETSRM